jgi:hypothetical protein
MIIEIDDWKFNVDIDATMAYSAEEAAAHCTCGYCRNFYAAVDWAYPDLRRFLADFGVHIEASEELMPYEPTVMDGYYAVCGKVLQFGSKPMTINGLFVTVADPKVLHMNVYCPAPFFVLNTGMMSFPWVLDEPAEEVLSTANEPEFLQKMMNRLLQIGSAEKLKQ